MRLSAGTAELLLAPETGGAIAAWTVAGVSILRPASPAAVDARGHACYPLVPFSNRVAHRRFRFAGTDYELPALLHDWAIHGAGWQLAWEARGASMHLDYPGGPLWPFAFHAEQEFDLQPHALGVTLRLTNTHSAPAPAAIGLHPFFPRDATTELRFQAGSVWQNGADMIPVTNTPVPTAWDFTARGPLGNVEIDNCFAGWNGEALLAWPDRNQALRITATPVFGDLVVLVPRQRDSVAIEPVSNMNDALNRMETPGHGMVVLQPGKTLEGHIHMTVETLR